MNPATINQSSRLLTNSLYATEHFNDLDQKEREAMTMDEFHRQTYAKQLEENNRQRQELEENALRVEEDQKVKKDQAKERHEAVQKLEDEYYSNLQKNQWSGGSYNLDSGQDSYGPIDNHLDNLKSKTYHNVEISDSPKKIGKYNEAKDKIGTLIKKTFTYRAPFREYAYDVETDKLIPEGDRYVTDNNVLNLKSNCLKNNDIQEVFDQKYKEKTAAAAKKSSASTKESFVGSELDPKLMEIYTKTLSPQDELDNKAESSSIFSYSHCLILVIIFFLLFRNTQ